MDYSLFETRANFADPVSRLYLVQKAPYVQLIERDKETKRKPLQIGELVPRLIHDRSTTITEIKYSKSKIILI